MRAGSSYHATWICFLMRSIAFLSYKVVMKLSCEHSASEHIVIVVLNLGALSCVDLFAKSIHLDRPHKFSFACSPARNVLELWKGDKCLEGCIEGL